MGWLWVCLGSAVGGGARYLLTNWAVRSFGAAFPFGTLLVNVTGSFLLAAIACAGLETGAIPPAVRLALTTGVLGGFTTDSTFSYEAFRLAQNGAWAWAGAYVLATVLGGLAASILGWASARWLLGA